MARAWNRFWFTGFSVKSLAMLRICFGIGLLFFHVTQFYTFFLLDLRGVHFYFMEPVWYFELLGIHRQDPILANAGFVLLELATLAMILGYRTRLAIGIQILLIFYLQGVRDSVTGDQHHRYLVPIQMLFFLMLSKCGEVYSLDARRSPRVAASGRAVPEWEASWPIKAMQVYCASFYFWSVLAKLRVTGWVWFTDPRRIQDLLLSRSLIWGATDAGGPVFNPLPYWLMQQETLCRILGFSTFLMEAGFPLILFMPSPRARLLFLLGVAFFHVANTVLAYVGFALFPIVFFIFFDLEKVRQRILQGPRRTRGLARALVLPALLLVLMAAPGRAEEEVVATIQVSSATAGSSLGGRLVEGRMRFRDAEYLLTLRGLAQSANSTATVQGLVRARDIEGRYQASDQGFRNSEGVTIRFDPPLVLEKDQLEIEVTSRKTPKISDGSRGSGVE